MKIPQDWLRTYVPAALQADAAAVAAVLTMGGLEVEDFAPAAAFTQVVVARVLEVHDHPHADRLKVCLVDCGEPQPRSIVCGAANVAAGLLVPCALPGGQLPGDVRISVATVRGVRSAGMLCSAQELGLAQAGAGLLVLPEGPAPGAELGGALGLNTTVFEVKLTPNRGDCLSVLGLARELSALTGAALHSPVPSTVATITAHERLPVRIDAPALCGRFTGRVLRGLNARAPTPAWLRQRLELCGQRSISALVDISNYVMLEIGQPSHVFDLAKLEGGLELRWAHPGETIFGLNAQTVKLDPQVGVVADARGAVAIAGIMGGLDSSVSLDTTDVYLEAAFWWPDAIQGRSRRLNIATEAAHRFERGVDFANTVGAMERLTQLILEVCATDRTRVGPIDDLVARLPARPPVALRLERLQRVLGLDLTMSQVLTCLHRLGLPTVASATSVSVTPPSYRFDLQCEVDLIEEVARVHGYDKIPARAPVASASMRSPPEGSRSAHQLRQAMAYAGYQELVNFSFVPESWETAAGTDPASLIRVLNPIASQYSVMRTNLLGGLLANLRYNLNRQATRVRSFELGRVFRRDPAQTDGPDSVAGVYQAEHLAGLAFGQADDEQWGVAPRVVDYFDVKGDLETLLLPLTVRCAAAIPAAAGRLAALHPGRCASVFLGERSIGWIGVLHPRLCKDFELAAAPVVFEVEVAPLLHVGLPQVREVARFPGLVRDLAVWVDTAVAAGAVLDDVRGLVAREAPLGIVRAVYLFDVFQPPAPAVAAPEAGDEISAETASGLLNKEKSLALRMFLQDTQRSLAESDADAARAAIGAHLIRRWGARLRQ